MEGGAWRGVADDQTIVWRCIKIKSISGASLRTCNIETMFSLSVTEQQKVIYAAFDQYRLLHANPKSKTAETTDEILLLFQTEPLINTHRETHLLWLTTSVYHELKETFV